MTDDNSRLVRFWVYVKFPPKACIMDSETPDWWHQGHGVAKMCENAAEAQRIATLWNERHAAGRPMKRKRWEVKNENWGVPKSTSKGRPCKADRVKAASHKPPRFWVWPKFLKVNLVMDSELRPVNSPQAAVKVCRSETEAHAIAKAWNERYEAGAVMKPVLGHKHNMDWGRPQPTSKGRPPKRNNP